MVAKKITIASVAKAASVSLGTVSRVLNDRSGKIKISDATRIKVLEAAKELGYRPNPFATALRTNKSGIVGVILRDIGDPFLRKLIRNIQVVCHGLGLELLIGHAEYELETAERQIDMMLNHLFDGLLFLGNMPGDEKLIQKLAKQRMPVVLVAGSHEGIINSVNYDNAHGTRIALDHLRGLGHRRIAFIGNTEHAGVKKREEVFLKHVREYDLYWDEAYCYPNAKRSGNALANTKALLRLPKPPTAILCSSDLLAIGAMSGAWQMGRQVPRDITIMGYDDIDAACEAYAPLTTIRQPTFLAAEKAVGILVDHIDNPKEVKPVEKFIIMPELVERSSSAPPPFDGDD